MSERKFKTILVTGGAGFIGSNLVKEPFVVPPEDHPSRVIEALLIEALIHLSPDDSFGIIHSGASRGVSGANGEISLLISRRSWTKGGFREPIDIR